MDVETYASHLPDNMSDDNMPLTTEELVLLLEARFDYNPPINPSVICERADMYGLSKAYQDGQRSVVDYLQKLNNKRTPLE